MKSEMLIWKGTGKEGKSQNRKVSEKHKQKGIIEILIS